MPLNFQNEVQIIEIYGAQSIVMFVSKSMTYILLQMGLIGIIQPITVKIIVPMV